MNVKSKEMKENSAIELVIEVSAEEFDKAINKVYNKQKKNLSVPGFRKGKAPRKLVEAMYGADVFYEDAIEESYPDAYSEALKQESIDPVAYPKLEIDTVGKEGYTFKALVTVRPEAKVSEYKGLVAPRAEISISDEDIDREMQSYIDRASRLVSVEREAQMGDTVVIDFEGFKDGVPFEGGKAENHSLELGSHSFVPGFEDQLVGSKAGDELDLDITFPEDYTPELAGASVVFKVKVHEIKERQVPTLDDEFAKDVSEFDTLAELRADLGEKLRVRLENRAKSEYEKGLMDQLLEHLEAEVPDAMLQYQIDKSMEDYAIRVQSQGIRFEDYLSMIGMTPAKMRDQLKDSSLRQIKTDLALIAVAEAEGMEVSEEEMEEEIKNLSEEYDMEPEQIREAVPEKDLKHDLLMKKARQLVVENGQVGEPPVKEEAAEEAPDEAVEGENKPEENPEA